MAEQTNGCSKGMASDLCLGRPASSRSDGRHKQYGGEHVLMSRAVNWSAYATDRGAVINSADYSGNMESAVNYDNGGEAAGLEGYVRELQGEREKLETFRREVPVCVELLDQAIEDSRMKLARAVASNRSIASFASYRAPHFNLNDSNKDSGNNNRAPAYVVNFNKQQQQVLAGPGSVQCTAGRTSGSASDEEGSVEAAAASARQLRMWGAVPTCDPERARAQHDDPAISTKQQSHELQLVQRPEAINLFSSTNSTTTASLPHIPQISCSAFYPNIAYHNPLPSAGASAPGRPSLLHGQLCLVNSSGDNNIRPIQQGEVTTPILCNSSADQTFPSFARLDTFTNHNANGFQSSSSNINTSADAVENMHGCLQLAREVHNYRELVIESMQEQMNTTASTQYNNIVSSGGCLSGSPTPRKARRCWSPELHQRFLHALQQLGGPRLATPKQIREVMHVEGLTNDEVKSHLQKFRLHTIRRPAPIQAAAADDPAQQPHHLVLFGGIWMPSSPAELAPVAACQLATTAQAASSPGHNYVQFQHVIGQHPNMQALLAGATAMDHRHEQLLGHAGVESASEVDVARSDQSSQNGEAAGGGVDNSSNMAMQEEELEDTEIHLGSRPTVSKDITSPIAKARYC
ncbi:hypothetical protein L7F22_002273 [Adiantum nelumboides]|nr:hypothetical protein [Adiantum nelumboides]